MKRLLKSALWALLVLALSLPSFAADTLQVMQGGKILPQYLGINATGSIAWNNSTGALTYSAESGRLRRITVFTTNGTYEKSTWLKFVKGVLVAAGGSGAGAVSTTSGQCSVASAGSGAAYSFFHFNATELDVETVITIPQAVTGGTGANGTNGGAASFGTLVTVPGGKGGIISGASATIAAVNGVAGAVAGVGGYLNFMGESSGFTRAATTAGIVGPMMISNGGDSLFGGAGMGFWGSQGGIGRNPGAGGGGTVNYGAAGALVGGTSAGGICILEEYE